ncbi:MAG: HNH endonuclease [Proteobacteria bacterium]|nr:HNH endonuclease [Pseudomonadota bacterium]
MKKEYRLKVFHKYDKKCAYCGKEIKYKQMQVDHLHPKALKHYYQSDLMKDMYNLKGKSIEDFSNLMPSCRRCNHYKRALPLEEFRTLMKTIHERIAEIYIAKVAIDYGIIKIHKWDEKFHFEQL